MNRMILAAAWVSGDSSLLVDSAVKGTAILVLAAIAAVILSRLGGDSTPCVAAGLRIAPGCAGFVGNPAPLASAARVGGYFAATGSRR